MTTLKRRSKYDLRDRAILVQVISRGFAISRYDRSATKDFETYAGTNEAGKFIKSLFTKEEMAEITRIQGMARAIHYRYSLQWIAGGIRIMPIAFFEDFSKEISEVQNLLDVAVKDIVNKYDTIIKNAKRRLNKLFDETEYPTKQELKERFQIVVKFFPVPDKEDFRNVPDDIIEEFEGETSYQYQDAVNEMWTRFRTVLEHAVTQLSKKEGKLFESVITNIRDMVELLPKLNILDDKELDKSVAIADEAFSDVTIEQLRENPSKRKRKAKEAKACLDRMAQYLT